MLFLVLPIISLWQEHMYTMYVVRSTRAGHAVICKCHVPLPGAREMDIHYTSEMAFVFWFDSFCRYIRNSTVVYIRNTSTVVRINGVRIHEVQLQVCILYNCLQFTLFKCRPTRCGNVCNITCPLN